LLPIIGHSQVGLRGRIRSVLEHNTLAMMGMRCALSYLATQSWKRCGDPAMIPDDQKQLNIAFYRISIAYNDLRHEERYRTLRMGKQLYAVAAKLPQR